MFSFYPKNLAAFSDGGMISTSNKTFFTKAKAIRQYGWDQMKSPKSNLVGINSRLDEIQASILDLN